MSDQYQQGRRGIPPTTGRRQFLAGLSSLAAAAWIGIDRQSPAAESSAAAAASPMPMIQLGKYRVSRLIVGNNPLLGYSYLGPHTDRHMKELCVDWDTTGLSDMPNSFRFYATVDPTNEVEELHEWKDDQGNIVIHGNNEGYWPWGGGIHVVKKEPVDAEASDYSSIVKVDWNGDPLGPMKATAGKEYLLQARIQAESDSTRFHSVVFTDGDPSEGNVISIRRVSIVEGETLVTTRWTPDSTGEKTIYVHLVHSGEELSYEESTDQMEVVVYSQEGPSTWREKVLYNMMPEL